MTPSLIAWLTALEDVHERRARIVEYLAHEGYELPSLPRNADYDEAGMAHRVRSQEMTVAYSVVDQAGRRVYHYVENETGVFQMSWEVLQPALQDDSEGQESGRSVPYMWRKPSKSSVPYMWRKPSKSAILGHIWGYFSRFSTRPVPRNELQQLNSLGLNSNETHPNETDHILLNRIEHGDEWAIELLNLIPTILKTGHAVEETFDKVIYQSRRTYRHPDGWLCPLRVVIKIGPRGR